MKCEQVRQAFWESAEAGTAPRAEMLRHLEGCGACATAVAQQEPLHRLLDCWQPEVELAPDFDRTLAQRIRVAAVRPGWVVPLEAARRWLSTPMGWNAGLCLASFALFLMVGVTVLLRPDRSVAPPDRPVRVQAGAVVHDLQVLDRDRDLIENFDLLSEESAPDPATHREESQ